MPYYFKKFKRFTYEIIDPPVNLALSLEDLKEQLKITISDNEEDCYLRGLIKTVSDYFESYTNRILINTKFKTFRDSFFDCLELKKSKLVTLDSFKYLKDSVLTVVNASIYYVTSDSLYSSIFLNDGSSWPGDVDFRMQAIEIEFTAGYGLTESSIPLDIHTALLQHATYLYTNRGDCVSTAQGNSVPKFSQDIYDLYKIVSLC